MRDYAGAVRAVECRGPAKAAAERALTTTYGTAPPFMPAAASPQQPRVLPWPRPDAGPADLSRSSVTVRVRQARPEPTSPAVTPLDRPAEAASQPMLGPYSSIIRLCGDSNMAAALRGFSYRPADVLDALGADDL